MRKVADKLLDAGSYLVAIAIFCVAAPCVLVWVAVAPNSGKIDGGRKESSFYREWANATLKNRIYALFFGWKRANRW
jgi:hypothetical protein